MNVNEVNLQAFNLSPSLQYPDHLSKSFRSHYICTDCLIHIQCFEMGMIGSLGITFWLLSKRLVKISSATEQNVSSIPPANKKQCNTTHLYHVNQLNINLWRSCKPLQSLRVKGTPTKSSMPVPTS